MLEGGALAGWWTEYRDGAIHVGPESAKLGPAQWRRTAETIFLDMCLLDEAKVGEPMAVHVGSYLAYYDGDEWRSASARSRYRLALATLNDSINRNGICPAYPGARRTVASNAKQGRCAHNSVLYRV